MKHFRLLMAALLVASAASAQNLQPAEEYNPTVYLIGVEESVTVDDACDKLELMSDATQDYLDTHRHGFQQTGVIKYLNETLLERELRWDRLFAIRQAERISHEKTYGANGLYEPGSWLAKPVKTVLETLPLLAGREDFRALDLGCGVGRNAIAVAKAFPEGSIDCVDILPGAIGKLEANAEKYGVTGVIRGILSGIDQFAIEREGYDLILAVSALEHMDSREAMLQKLTEIRQGIRPGGIVCLIMNSGVRERETDTGTELVPQFEVNLPAQALISALETAFSGWQVVKHTVVRQQYEIPRDREVSLVQTDVVTYVVRRGQR